MRLLSGEAGNVTRKMPREMNNFRDGPELFNLKLNTCMKLDLFLLNPVSVQSSDIWYPATGSSLL